MTGHHGITEDLELHGWNPFVGAFAEETTTSRLLAALLPAYVC